MDILRKSKQFCKRGKDRVAAWFCLEPTRSQEQDERMEQVQRNLKQICCNVEKLPTSAIDPGLFSALRLRTEVLNLDDDGDYANSPPDPNFFRPLPEKEHREHTAGILGCFTRRDYASSCEQFLCYRIDRSFCESVRKEIKEGRLPAGSYWSQRNLLFDDLGGEDLFPPGMKFNPKSGWKVKRDLFPHVMLNTYYGPETRHEGEDLLREEVMDLVEAIRTRLKKKEWKQHRVIPVMMFSFRRHMRARILQGYFDGYEVVIRRTKLYDFFPDERANANWDLFRVLMASTPYGDTKNFQLRDFVPLTNVERVRLQNASMGGRIFYEGLFARRVGQHV